MIICRPILSLLARGSGWLMASAAAPAYAQAGQPVAFAAAPGGGLLQVLSGLIAVLALMATVVWLLRRINPAGTSNAGNIRIIGGVSVGSRERVVVVEVADQWIVVGVAPGRVNALSSMPRSQLPVAEEHQARNGRPGAFSGWLEKSIKQRNERR